MTATTLKISPEDADTTLAELSRDQLLEFLDTKDENGIRIAFSGKDNARRLARSVRPRVSRGLGKYSIGSSEEQSVHTVIEGDNLQALATLYKERSQVDLIITYHITLVRTFDTTIDGMTTQTIRNWAKSYRSKTVRGTLNGCVLCGLAFR